MRSLLLAVFVGLALASVDEEAFRRNRHYIYRYEAQLVTGAPQSSKLWSGLRLTANLNLFFLTDKRVTAMLTEINLQKLEGYVEGRTPSFFMLDEGQFMEGVEADLNPVMVNQLQRPFGFTWNQGSMEDLAFEPTEPLWSSNIKRGAASLFQVNLDRKYSLQPVPDKGSQFDPIMPSYTVWESTTFGYCRTTYTPKPEPVANGFYLSKVRDYSSCAKASPMSLVFNNYFVKPEDRANATKHLDMQAEVTYAIKGDKSNFIIMTAVGESKVVFVPYSYKDGSVQTSINQTVYLLTAKDIQNPRPPAVVPRKEEKATLEMVLPIQGAEDRRPYAMISGSTFYRPASPWGMKKLDQLLTWVANATDAYPCKGTLLTMQTLMELLRQSPPYVLKELMERVINYRNMPDSPLGYIKFKVYWDLLTTAGTTGSASVLLDTCLQDEGAITKECVSAVTGVGMYTPPSEVIITKLTMLLRKMKAVERQTNQETREQPKVKEIVMVTALALGSIMGRAEDTVKQISRRVEFDLQDMQKILDQNTALDKVSGLQNSMKWIQNNYKELLNRHHAIVNNFTQEMKKQFLEGDKDFDVILCLKAFRNARLPATMPTVRHYLTKVQYNSLVRIAAAQAFDKFYGEEQPVKTEVLNLLEMILKNPSDATAVRIQAFRSLLNLRAPVTTLIRVAQSLRFEKERQLTTYIWSVFQAVANETSFAPYKDFAPHFRSALLFAPPLADAGMMDSYFYRMYTPLAPGAAILSTMNYINTPRGVTMVDTPALFQLFGASNEFTKVTFMSEGLEKVMKKMFGPRGFFTERNSVFDLLRRTKRAADAKDMIYEIFRKLSIKTREWPEVKAYLSLQLFNNDVRAFDITTFLQNIVDLNIVEANFNEDKLRAGLSFNYKTSGILMQFFTELPTEAGFPVSLQMGVTYYAKAMGAVRASVAGSWYKDARAYTPPRRLEAGFYVNPQWSASVMGKMAVDGYLLQTGSQFYGTVEYKTPFSINATFDLAHSHLALKISPPVNTQEPVLKVEFEPSVFSCVVANNVSLQQLPVNRRPVFYNMQPITIANGARMYNFALSWTSQLLGYTFRVEGQSPIRTTPQAPALPLMGKAQAALYVTPGPSQPPYISAEFRYFSKPRFVSPTAPKRGACDSWWTAFGFLCFGTDEESAVETTGEYSKPLPLAPPYGDFPSLYQHITFDSVKQKIEKRVGHPIPLLTSSAQWAFIATLNSSAPGARRGFTVEGLLQAWREGQFHQHFFTLFRTPIPAYDPQPWQMNVKTSSLYPSEQFSLNDLLDPEYQRQASSSMFTLMKTREQRVVNKYVQQHLFTKLSQDAMRAMPALEPRVMLDRILPEMIFKAPDSLAYRLRATLMRLLPLCQQVEELREEAKDALTVGRKQQLLMELARQIPRLQAGLAQLLQYTISIGQQPGPATQMVKAASEYAVLKLSQAVFRLRDILQRAVQLHLVAKPTFFLGVTRAMEQQQLALYKLALLALAPPQPSGPMGDPQGPAYQPQPQAYPGSSRIYRYQPQPATEQPFAQPASQTENAPPTTPDVATLMTSLKRLARQQLEDIHDVWQAVLTSQPVPKERVKALIHGAAHNVTLINRYMQLPEFDDPRVKMLLTQASVQHQILVEMLHVIRYSNYSYSEPVYAFSSQDRYALKVQTTQLLERAHVMHQQAKLSASCAPQLSQETERHIMSHLQTHDRALLALPHSYVTVPNDVTPWTSDGSLRHAAWSKLSEVLQGCRTIRDALLSDAKLQHLCLAAKLVETAVSLQRKVYLLKSTLPALAFHKQLTAKYQILADQTMSFLLSLTSVFDKYVNYVPENQPSAFPSYNIPISQGLLEVTMIRHQQKRISKQLDKFFYSASPSPDVIKRVLANAAEKIKALTEKLETEAPRVEGSLQTTTALTAYSVLRQYTEALHAQQALCQHVQHKLQQHDLHAALPALHTQTYEEMKKIAKLLQLTSSWRLPTADADNSDDTLSPFFGADKEEYNPGMSAEGFDLPDIMKEMPKLQPISPDKNPFPEMPFGSAMKKQPRGFYPIVLTANITYTGQNYMGIQILGRKSVRQLLWETAQFYPQSRDSCVSRALQETLAGRERLEICSREVARRINSYQQLHLRVATNTNAMPYYLQYGLHQFLTRMESTYYRQAEVSAPQPFIPAGHMQVIFDFSNTMDTADQYYLTAKETLEIQGVPLSRHVKALNYLQNAAPVPRWALSQYSHGRLPATCKVDRYNVRTNDGAVYRLPRLANRESTAGCKTLLAMDCSADKTFAISVQQDKKTLAQALEILAEQHHVEVIPDYISDRVRVDGKEEVVKFGQPIVKYKTIAYGREAVALIISRRRGGYIHVEYPLVGLDIFFDFYYISIDMSHVYQKQLCGLCGNFDGQRTLELEGPQRQIFAAANDFFRSYVIPGDQCSVTPATGQPAGTEQAAGILPVQRPYDTSPGAQAPPPVPAYKAAAEDAELFNEGEEADMY